MTLHVAMTFDREPENMPAFVRYLQAVGFPHRINEQNGKLTLWVYDSGHIDWVRQQYELFQQGALADIAPAGPAPLKGHLWLRRYPATALLMLLSVAGFAVATLQIVPWLSALSYQGFVVSNGSVVMNSHEQFLAQLANGQWWRLVTPMFLHFGFMHLAFNLTFLGYFGHQVERERGSGLLLLWAMLMSVIANAAQYISSNDVLFGGMSGVNYGLLAYCAVSNYLGAKRYNFPPGLFWVSVVLMLLGFVNMFSLFGYSIANWAHLGGFVAGILLALLRR